MYFRKLIFFFSFFYFILQETGYGNDLHSHILKTILSQNSCVIAFEWQEKKYWLKKSNFSKFYWLEWLGREIGAIAVPIKFLKPTPYGIQAPLKLEKNRLLECELLKIQCPRLIDYGEDWLVISDAGISAEEYVKKLSKAQRFDFIITLAKTMFLNQKKGFYQGRYYLRDFLISKKGDISVFDFEEDPLAIMTADEANAREIFHFTVSVLPTLDSVEMKKFGFWLNKNLNFETKKSLLKLNNHKFLFKLLVFFKKHLRRDFIRFINAAYFILNNISIK